MLDEKALYRKMLRDALAYGDHISKEPEFVPGETPIPVTRKIWGGEEMSLMVAAVLDGWWTEGRFTDEFEKQFAEWLGVRFASFCNSGSSANFLALGACMSHLCGEQRLRVGDPVITTAAGFPTTINPIFFWRLKPIFIDTKVGTLLPEEKDIEKAIDKYFINGRGAIMIAHTLGNPWPAHRFMERGFFVIEDNCDALGSMIDDQKTGTLGHLATHSFYPAHHMTTGEGGMVVTNNGLLKKAVESIRDWGRGCWCPPGKNNTCGKRFDWEFENLPDGYDHKYTYSHVGLNLKSTDVQAALGLAQLNRLDSFITKRKVAFAYMMHHARPKLWQKFHLPGSYEKANPSWFGFPLTVRRSILKKDNRRPMVQRDKLIRFLNERKIGTRLLFASNYIRQPVFQNMIRNNWNAQFEISDHLAGTDRIVDDTFWIACHPGLSTKMIDYMIDSIEEFAYEHQD